MSNTSDDYVLYFHKLFKTLLDNLGIGNSPAIRNLLAEIAPLVNEGKTVFGQTKDTKETDGWPAYEYDDAGKVA